MRRPSWSWICLHLVFAGLALLAGRLDLRGVRIHERAVGLAVKTAMQRHAMAVMEQTEAFAWEYEAARDADVSAQYEHEAELLAAQSAAEKRTAAVDEQRAEAFRNESALEEEYSKVLYHQAEEDWKLHEAILSNLTVELEKKDAIERELQKVHSGACRWWILSMLCDAVGNIALLESELDDEYILIHQEWRAAVAVERREEVEEFVADALHNRSVRYNRTAEELVEVAALWRERSREDAMRAAEANATALEWRRAAAYKDARAQLELQWEARNEQIAARMWQEADAERNGAYADAVVAMPLAVAAAVFYVANILRRLFGFVQYAAEISVSKQQSLRGAGEAASLCGTVARATSYAAQHVLVFLLVVGSSVMGGSYLVHLDDYSVRECAVVILAFGSVASAVQSILLHALPHAMALQDSPPGEWTFAKMACSVLEQFFKRYVVLTLLFVVEILFVWLTARRWLFTDGAVTWLGQPTFRAFALLSLAVHVFVFEPRPLVSDANGGGDDETVTILLVDDEDDDGSASGEESESVGGQSPFSRATPMPPSIGPTGTASGPYNNTGSWWPSLWSASSLFPSSGTPPPSTLAAAASSGSPAATETSSSTSSSGSPTETALLNVRLGPEGRRTYSSIARDDSSPSSSSNDAPSAAATATALEESSPYVVDLSEEASRLLVPLQVLLAACMIAVIRNCLPLLWGNEYARRNHPHTTQTCWIWVIVAAAVTLLLQVVLEHRSRRVLASSLYARINPLKTNKSMMTDTIVVVEV